MKEFKDHQTALFPMNFLSNIKQIQKWNVDKVIEKSQIQLQKF